ncbi:MAG: tRNA uridine(34) 5-carboxymethylaminomethyl modification radical SAM/GNAT enzyme Elp3 [Conexivisphaera sp.]
MASAAGKYASALAEIAREAEALASAGRLDRERLERLKLEVARRLALDRVPSNEELSALLSEGTRRLVATRPSRRLSGIVTATVAAAPHECPPNARCIYCPGGASVGTPKSYTEDSPAVIQASRVSYDPRLQVEERLSVLRRLGHPTSKVEVIIVGGTFPYYPREYQVEFVKGIFDGLNGFASGSLEEAMEANERSPHRCVGLTVETRPDFCRERDVDLMLSYGVTRIEIGVQALDERVLRRIGRGHGLEEVAEAIRVAKDAGLKVGVHMMPCLPGRTRDEDLRDILELFRDESYRPDMLKIYPTLVLRGTPLHRMYERGLYRPCDEGEVVELLVRALTSLPPWVRVMRVQREIPPYAVVAGPRRTGLRDAALREIARRGLRCTEIRCREVGREGVDPSRLGSFGIVKRYYAASGGREAFISMEDPEGRIAGFLRLRLPSPLAHRPEVAGGRVAIVRELRVYGSEVDVGARDAAGWQHRGIGGALMREAEAVAADEWGADEVLVTSAVGTREYYRRLGYARKGPYMAKRVR